jgi:hypothetical protein
MLRADTACGTSSGRGTQGMSTRRILQGPAETGTSVSRHCMCQQQQQQLLLLLWRQQGCVQQMRLRGPAATGTAVCRRCLCQQRRQQQRRRQQRRRQSGGREVQQMCCRSVETGILLWAGSYRGTLYGSCCWLVGASGHAVCLHNFCKLSELRRAVWTPSCDTWLCFSFVRIKAGIVHGALMLAGVALQSVCLNLHKVKTLLC